LDSFEWFGLGCGVVSLSAGLAIQFGGWQLRNRLVVYALLVAVGLALGTALGRLAALSVPIFLGVLAIYLAVRWIAGRRVR
jgi:hypothetical protein